MSNFSSNVIIDFKSIPELYEKENLGLKSNTVRRKDDENDLRFQVLDGWICATIKNLAIRIINSKDTTQFFERAVTDVTKWEGLYIISW